MILAIDVGNTNIVIGGIDENKIYFRGRFSTDKQKTELEYAIMFKNIFDIHGISADDIDGAVISSVVPPLVNILRLAVEMSACVSPLIINHRTVTGLTIDVDNRKQLGNDLVVAAAAAIAEYKPPIIIFDLGTATTISVINADGVYIGGVIIPGIKVSQTALSSGTSQLPYISLDAPENVIGRNTIDCMKSGAIFATASMMDGMIERIEEELGAKAVIAATGGLAKTVVPYCRHDIAYDDDLLLKGMWIIYSKNR